MGIVEVLSVRLRDLSVDFHSRTADVLEGLECCLRIPVRFLRIFDKPHRINTFVPSNDNPVHFQSFPDGIRRSRKSDQPVSELSDSNPREHGMPAATRPLRAKMFVKIAVAAAVLL